MKRLHRISVYSSVPKRRKGEGQSIPLEYPLNLAVGLAVVPVSREGNRLDSYAAA